MFRLETIESYLNKIFFCIDLFDSDLFSGTVFFGFKCLIFDTALSKYFFKDSWKLKSSTFTDYKSCILRSIG
jgi:hypothetical protein